MTLATRQRCQRALHLPHHPAAPPPIAHAPPHPDQQQSLSRMSRGATRKDAMHPATSPHTRTSHLPPKRDSGGPPATHHHPLRPRWPISHPNTSRHARVWCPVPGHVPSRPIPLRHLPYHARSTLAHPTPTAHILHGANLAPLYHPPFTHHWPCLVTRRPQRISGSLGFQQRKRLCSAYVHLLPLAHDCRAVVSTRWTLQTPPSSH